MHDLDGYRALATANAMVSEAYASAMLANAYGLDSVRLSRIVTEKDDTFAVRPRACGDPAYLLKIENAAEDYETVRLRAMALRILECRAPAIPCTRIIASLDGDLLTRCDTSGGVRWATLTTFVAGSVLSTMPMPYRSSTLRDIGRRLAQMQKALGEAPRGRRCHSTRVLWDVRLLPVLADDLGGLLSGERQRALMATAVASYRVVESWIETLPESLCHGDFHPGNILVNGDRGGITGIIDFGDMHMMPVVCDLGTCMFYCIDDLADDPLAGCAQVLEGYLRADPTFDRRQLALLPSIMKARCALTVLLPLLVGQASRERQGHYSGRVVTRLRQLEFLESTQEGDLTGELMARLRNV
jgi:Ser/Thr protein kinase RdoA (MazF antagonist)